MNGNRSYETGGYWRWLVLLTLFPLCLWGHQRAAFATTRAQTHPPAGAESVYTRESFKTPSPEGLVGSRDLLSWGASLSAGYDDNVSQTDRNRLADTGFLFSPYLAVNREDGRMSLDLTYRPTLLVYRHLAAYNEQDHDLNFRSIFRVTDRLRLQAQTDALYRSGLLDSFLRSAPVSEPAAAGVLNDTIVTPFANQFENNSRVGIHYQVNSRATLGIFTTYMLRSFAKSAVSSVPLYGTEGESAGVRYAYRTGPRSTLAMTYVYEAFHTGAGTRVGLNTAAISWALAVTPRLQINAFAGPVYGRTQGSLFVPLSPSFTLSLPIDRSDWHWTAGGGIAFEEPKSLFQINGARRITDGGGLLSAVTSDVLDGSFERHLAGKWTVRWSAGWQRNVGLEAGAEPGQLDGEFGRIVLLRQVSESLTAGAGYQFERQRAGGAVPLGASFDRNFIYFTLKYRFQTIHLGR